MCVSFVVVGEDFHQISIVSCCINWTMTAEANDLLLLFTISPSFHLLFFLVFVVLCFVMYIFFALTNIIT